MSESKKTEPTPSSPTKKVPEMKRKETIVLPEVKPEIKKEKPDVKSTKLEVKPTSTELKSSPTEPKTLVTSEPESEIEREEELEVEKGLDKVPDQYLNYMTNDQYRQLTQDEFDTFIDIYTVMNFIFEKFSIQHKDRPYQALYDLLSMVPMSDINFVDWINGSAFMIPADNFDLTQSIMRLDPNVFARPKPIQFAKLMLAIVTSPVVRKISPLSFDIGTITLREHLKKLELPTLLFPTELETKPEARLIDQFNSEFGEKLEEISFIVAGNKKLFQKIEDTVKEKRQKYESISGGKPPGPTRRRLIGEEKEEAEEEEEESEWKDVNKSAYVEPISKSGPTVKKLQSLIPKVTPYNLPIFLRRPAVQLVQEPYFVNYDGQMVLPGSPAEDIQFSKHGMATQQDITDTIQNLEILLDADQEQGTALLEPILYFMVINSSSDRTKGDLPIKFTFKSHGKKVTVTTDYSNVKICLRPSPRRLARSMANHTYKMLKQRPPPPYLLNRWKLPINMAHICFDFVDYCTCLQPEELRFVDYIKKRTLRDNFEKSIVPDRIDLFFSQRGGVQRGEIEPYEEY